MGVNPGEILIDDSTPEHVTHDVVIDGDRKGRGLVPRDYAAYPPGCFAHGMRGVDFPLIPESEWSDRIKDMEATKSRISDIRLTGNNGSIIPSLDQDGWGYCWAHSSTQSVIMLRAIGHEPYVPLSAFAIACILRNYRDQGGFGAESMDFIMQRGVPAQEFWPQQSTDRAHDNPQTWANAARHKITAGFMDLEAPEGNRTLSWQQVMTCLLLRIPVVSDYNWWSHSVLAIDPVEVEPGSFGVRILNSWSDTWSDKGMGVLQGNKARPDGAVAPRVTLPSLA